MQTREQINRETYQQAVKFAEFFADDELKREYLKEAEERYQFEKKHSQTLQDNRKMSPLVTTFILLIIAIVSTAIYWQTGRYQTVEQGIQMHEAFKVETEIESKEHKNDRYIMNLQDRLRQNPNDGDLWYELGQAYALNNDFNSAQVCYQNAQKVLGEKAVLYGAMATADYYDNDQKITEQGKRWIEKALSLNDKESTSLLLLASESFKQKDYQQAINHWRKVLDSDNEAVDRRAIIQRIQMAKENLNSMK